MGHLSALVLVPALAALVVAMIPAEQRSTGRWVATLGSLIPLVMALLLWGDYEPTGAAFQFVERYPWIDRFGVSLYFGIDGISLLLILLTTLLTPIILFSATDSIKEKLTGYLCGVLLLEAAMLGTLVSLDALVFYVFWELMLIPMFLIIGIWGGPRRRYAAIKFVLFTMAGSLPMLIALIYMGLGGDGSGGFALTALYENAPALSDAAKYWCCLALIVGFAVKVPMWPLHTWLPDAHVEAPTGGSVILAGVLLKMGTYGFVRMVLPMFPEVFQIFVPWIAALAVVGIVYGALVAMVQPDMKKLVAYSSVSHLGFVMLGIASMNVIGVQGAVYQMIGHGLSTGGLFMLVGMIYERRHTRQISAFGGLWRQVPVFSVCLLIVTMASIGLPGLAGFVGEFLILLGSFRRDMVTAGLATSGLVLGAVYMLWLFQRVIFGKLDHPENARMKDMTASEFLALAPIVVLIFVMGVYPQPFLDTMAPSVERILAMGSDASSSFAANVGSGVVEGISGSEPLAEISAALQQDVHEAGNFAADGIAASAHN